MYPNVVVFPVASVKPVRLELAFFAYWILLLELPLLWDTVNVVVEVEYARAAVAAPAVPAGDTTASGAPVYGPGVPLHGDTV
ncbi:hypothetical protein GCM10009543_07540 [Leifsonia naganoensis]